MCRPYGYSGARGNPLRVRGNDRGFCATLGDLNGAPHAHSLRIQCALLEDRLTRVAFMTVFRTLLLAAAIAAGLTSAPALAERPRAPQVDRPRPSMQVDRPDRPDRPMNAPPR